jgi:NhaA family Na+:H+ antiporter
MFPASTDEDNKSDIYGGIALGLATIGALVIANSSLGETYHAWLEAPGEIRIGSVGLSQSLVHWINDGLMAIFFLLVGLEIKREVFEGALASRRKAMLPVIAAIGGFVMPALIYVAFNWGDESELRGWAIPCATDIAFATSICAILGRRVPGSLKAFLLALAIIDDLLAIIVIAVFYTAHLSALSLALAGAGVLGLALLNLFDVRRPSAYVILGVFTWVCVLQSGVHATLAGVAAGLAMPLTRGKDPTGTIISRESLVEHAERALEPWVVYCIVPIFAFANAGISLKHITLASVTAPIPLGIVAGLFLGKQLGVLSASFSAIKLGICEPPAAASMTQFYAVAILTGVGFTMSLFIGSLAFESNGVTTEVRLGVLIASLLSAIVSALVFLITSPKSSLS